MLFIYKYTYIACLGNSPGISYIYEILEEKVADIDTELKSMYAEMVSLDRTNRR
jgi:hypothetical protein